MNPLSKIEKEDIVNPSEIPLLQSLECSIDSMIPLNPIMCLQCKNIFCSDCLTIWKEKSQTCPMRCNPLETISIDRTIIRDQINRIKVKCKYNLSGCKHGILIPDKTNHELHCKYRPVSCKKCNESIPLILLLDHYKSNCKGCLIQCFLCDKLIHWGEIANHIKLCSIPSDFNQSSACSICFNHSHIKDNCPYNIVKCIKCGLVEIHQEILTSKHICQMKTEENYINEYYNQLTQRYEQAMNKLIKDKEEKLNGSMIKIEEVSNDIKAITIKQIEELDNQIVKIKDRIRYNNDEMTKDLNNTICGLKSEIEMIKAESINLFKEEKSINDLLSFIQASLIKELNAKISLKDNEVILERKFLIKAYQYSQKENKLTNKVINDLMQSGTDNEVNNNEQCEGCNKTSKLQKCGSCSRKICTNCGSKCQNCKQNALPMDKDKDKSYCSKCFSNCSKCSKTACNNCFKKCYSNQCTNMFCIQCYEVNKHQVRGGSLTCKIFKCPQCQVDNICLMKTITHNNTRICWDCYCLLKN